MSEPIRYTVSSGNVFADLDLSNPEERLAKATLAVRIADIVDERGWADARATHALGMEESEFAALLDGRLSGFSIERLFRALVTLGQAIEIRVSPASSGDQSAGISVEIGEAAAPEMGGADAVPIPALSR